MQKIEIAVGTSLSKSGIKIDGVPLRGVRRVSFDLDGAKRGEMPFLTIEVFGEAIIEGEFREEEILRVERKEPPRD